MKENKFVNKNRGVDKKSISLELFEKNFEIIKSKDVIDCNEIVHLLNQMLDMEQTIESKNLYLRICLYYRTIDKEMAMEYAQFYLDTYNDGSVILKIKENETTEKKLARIL